MANKEKHVYIGIKNEENSNVSTIEITQRKPGYPFGTPLTFEITEAGTLKFAQNFYQTEGYVYGENRQLIRTTVRGRTIQVKVNDGEWQSVPSTQEGRDLATNLQKGDIIQVKGDNPTYGFSDYVYTHFTGTAKFILYGNIMSLIDSTNFETLRKVDANYTFYYLFSDSGVITAKNLILPLESIPTACYSSMFQGCTNLIYGPKLICDKISTVGVTWMFSGCTNLKFIECHATGITISGDNPRTLGTYHWVDGVQTNYGIFVKNPDMPVFYTSEQETNSGSYPDFNAGAGWRVGGVHYQALQHAGEDYLYDGIPEGWTIIDA